jgi:cytoskeletal protein CcmA (bactofilin family)
MAKRKKGFMNHSSSYDDSTSGGYGTPGAGEQGDGMWAKSEYPPASAPPGADDDAQDYGLGQDDESQSTSLAFPAVPREASNPPDSAGEASDESAAVEPVAAATEQAMPDATAETGERTTTVGRTIVIRGKLRSDENLIVRGRIEAEITSSKDLLLENSGIINADMRVKSVTISGIVVGDIHAQERVKLAPEARVIGDIYTPRLVVEDGAAFRGRVEMDGLEHLEGVKWRKPEQAEAVEPHAGVQAFGAEAPSYDALNDPALDDNAAPDEPPPRYDEY